VSNVNKTPGKHQGRHGSKFDVGSVWFAFRRRWFLILFLSLVTAGGTGYAVWRFLPPPKASANVIYEISADTPAVLARLPDEREFNSFKNLQSNIVMKRSVLASILNEPGITSIHECTLAKDPFKWLEDTLKIDFKLGREYMRVTADLQKAPDALALINAVHKYYIYEAVNKEKENRLTKLAEVQALKGENSKARDELLAKLRELGEKGGTPSDKVAALQQEFLSLSLKQSQAERLQISSEIRRLRIELAGRSSETKKAPKNDPPEHLIVAELEQNQQLKAEKAYLLDLERRHKEYQDTLAPGVSTPQLQTLAKAVAEQKAIVEALPTKLRAAAVESARAKHFITVSSDKESITKRLETAEALEKKLEAEIRSMAENVKQLSSTQHEFEKSKSEIALLEKLTETLSEKVQNMGIEIKARDRVNVFQEPTVVTPDDAPRRLKFALMAVLGGIVIGAAPVWFRELRRRIFHEEEQLVESVSIPLIGTIPFIPRKRRSHAKNAVLAQPRTRAMVTESIDSARATVLFKLQENGGRALMITSSVAGEAKSSVSGHIAISLARAGFRTLIIDSDMRRPTLHRVFGCKKGPGFSDVLLGFKDLEEATQSCQLQNLFVLTAGDWIPAASSSLASGAWTDVLNEAKERFDVVIVDSPPVLLVADALAMARDVDGVLLSALKDVSEIDLINKSVHKLESLGIAPMGMIASGVTHRMYTSRYYDRYASAYSQRVRG